MKYVYNGHYTTYLGRVFAYGKPVEVNDRATIQALEKHPDFRKIEDGKEENQAPSKAVLSDICPKCGKTVTRGKVMHQKWCKGK
jgi:hypothetical protein